MSRDRTAIEEGAHTVLLQRFHQAALSFAAVCIPGLLGRRGFLVGTAVAAVGAIKSQGASGSYKAPWGYYRERGADAYSIGSRSRAPVKVFAWFECGVGGRVGEVGCKRGGDFILIEKGPIGRNLVKGLQQDYID